ncbi:MAG: twin-arginine translocase TatA/TatE family subunit [Coriobacteriia bacterium]|nr:twin-arginine translocase TatA/TatE family subunit [Coriobacteriia bacterium]
MFGISGLELVIIIGVILFLFGPDKLPEIMKLIATAAKMFNNAKNEFESVVKTEILRPEDMQTVRTLQHGIGTITSTVKNPISLLNMDDNAKETADAVKKEVAGIRESLETTPPEEPAVEEREEAKPEVSGETKPEEQERKSVAAEIWANSLTSSDTDSAPAEMAGDE